jgi:hypothetical protein
MENKQLAAFAALIGGFVCLVLLVFVGRLTGSEMAAWALVSGTCFLLALGICWNHREYIWFTGLLLNVTIWLLMFVITGASAIRDHIAGLAFAVGFAYLGAWLGYEYPKHAKPRR